MGLLNSCGQPFAAYDVIVALYPYQQISQLNSKMHPTKLNGGEKKEIDKTQQGLDSITRTHT